GRSVSVNWPLWAEGGMQMDEASRQIMWRRTGLVPLGTDDGVQALANALAIEGHQLLVLSGQADRIRRLVLSPAQAVQARNPAESGTGADTAASIGSESLWPVYAAAAPSSAAGETAKITLATVPADSGLRAKAIRHLIGLLATGLKLP